MTRAVVALALFAAACHRRGMDPEACRAEGDALAKLLAGVDHGQVDYPHADDLALVPRRDLPTLAAKNLPALALLRDDRADVGPALAELRRTSAPDQHALVLAIDGATAWARVVAVVDAARSAGFDEPVFVFARPSTTTPPPRSPIDDELDAIAKSPLDGRAMKVTTLAVTTIEACRPLQKVFAEVRPDRGETADYVSRAVGPAMIECGCDLDVPRFRSLMWRMLANPHPIGSLALRFEPAAPPLALPAATPWRDASTQLATTTRTSALAIAP